MKLVLDLEEIETWDDETVAQRIKEAIEQEIDRYIKGLVKEALREHENAMRALVKRAAEKDWKRVAEVIEQLQGGSDD